MGHKCIDKYLKEMIVMSLVAYYITAFLYSLINYCYLYRQLNSVNLTIKYKAEIEKLLYYPLIMCIALIIVLFMQYLKPTITAIVGGF
jgi:uncharacterized membrane protein